MIDTRRWPAGMPFRGGDGVGVMDIRGGGVSRSRMSTLTQTLFTEIESAPLPGGPLFIPLSGGGPRQADINAAINIGLRAIASRFCLRARPKIRCELKDGKPAPVIGNKVEKVAAMTLKPHGKLSKEVSTGKEGRRLNFFVDAGGLAPFDQADIVAGKASVRVASGVAVWKRIKDGAWKHCQEINAARIAAWQKVK